MPWYGFTTYGAPDLPDVGSFGIGVGQIFMYPSSGAYDSTTMTYVTGPPEGFLRCDGSAVLITDYQDLYDFFVANGVSFGAAPVGQFRLPNMSGAWPVGLNTSDADFNVIGKTGGTLSHSHTVADGGHTHTVPNHEHFVPNHSHDYNNHTHTLPNHRHGSGTLSVPNSNANNPLYSGPTTSYAADVHSHNVSGFSDYNTGTTGDPSINKTDVRNENTTTFTDTPGAASASTNLNASGNNNLPPYRSFYFIIKV